MNGTNGLLVLAVLIGVPLLGGFLRGVDRKLTARLQGRIGPPIWQPFYDFLKLMGKKTLISSRATLAWACGYLALTLLATVLFFLGQDLLAVVLILGFGGACLALGAYSVRSPYAHLGANRELLQMFAYEPVLLLTAVAIFLKTGSFQVASVFRQEGALIHSLWPTFLAVLAALTIKMRKSPFDIAASEHAHQELVRGVYTEYSGKSLALIELAHWYELVLLLGLVFLFWARPWWAGLLLAVFSFFLEILIDNILARLRWRTMLYFTWVEGMGLALANIVYLNLIRGLL
ncbi:respiratory chain complex I subunit 1 family protein [Ammonifex thiophilus]|uniref:NADH-quinone oxidoreductase subunit H n=1 Tax=Ammonifex thiophilus TaxID=444093 RepID=A0A3D8P2H6_9THEO|nr:complex I subunit 1 family protein [Ammonifex thiophilus]RDV82458.1 NADH-quinone oxidoreductase subunit H [Ammonifex thiophilus]